MSLFQINTDITYAYKILPTFEIPVKSLEESKINMVIDLEAQERELSKKSNFETISDKVQVIHGHKNVSEVDDRLDVVAPYVCIMASAYAVELSLRKWRSRVVDFILESGLELYLAFEEPYRKVEDFHLEFEKTVVEIKFDVVLDTYVGKSLMET